MTFTPLVAAASRFEIRQLTQRPGAAGCPTCQAQTVLAKVAPAGERITRLETHQGFAAEMAAASTIELATRLGVPLSTTHTISTAIMGVGSVRSFSAVRWGVTGEIVGAWILTFPICGAISWVTVKLVRLLF